MGHVIWDWNGTLLDDFELNVAAVADSCASLGGPPVSAANYRANHTRPIAVFYERLLGRPLAQGEWAHLNETYHESYRRRLNGASLVTGAEDALRQVESSGATQSLLSMWEHHELVRLVGTFGLERFFVRVDGQPSTGGGTKHEHLERHMARLVDSLGPLDDVVMIGDSLDDARAAEHLGISCVLVEHGPDDPAALRDAGLAVAGSLLEALVAAGLAG